MDQYRGGGGGGRCQDNIGSGMRGWTEAAAGTRAGNMEKQREGPSMNPNLDM